jgi:DNA-binding MarR family transcriptional regulator
MCKKHVNRAWAMEPIIRDFQRYLKDILDVTVKPVPWAQADRLPFFLRDFYRFFTCSMLDIRCLLMVAREQSEQTPAVVGKHLEQVRAHWDAEVIYLHPLVTAYNRKRLIAQKVPFVVPGNQMFLPMLGVDLREHFRKSHLGGSMLSPSTQTVVLHRIYSADEQALTPSSLATRLGYTAMTLSRAFNELESVGLAEVAMQGRERMLRFNGTKRELWEKALEFMRNPVSRRFYIRQPRRKGLGPAAGLTALAHYTLLAPPTNPVYALNASDFKSLKQKNDITETDGPIEPEVCAIEVWSYPPQLFANDDVVDRLSLYLSLRDSEDERVEAALGKMIGDIPW